MMKFLEGLGFQELFEECVHFERAANARYNLFDVVFLIMIGVTGGARSIEKCVVLWSDRVLRRVTGWTEVPDDSTIGRIIKRAKERHINELETLNHKMRERVWARAHRTGRSSVAVATQKWIDIDSSVKTVYGHQEGAAKGYNTEKRGALSYHPLFAFCAETKEILQAWLRTGNAYTSNGIVEFLKQLLAHLPSQPRLLFRADRGFFSGALMEFLEERGHGYLIKVKLKGLKSLLIKQAWSPVAHQAGWEQCLFSYQAQGWKRPRGFLAVRCRCAAESVGQQGELFRCEPEYDYFCYVTSEPLSPWLAHRLYGQRATSETWIEEAKQQMAVGHLKTKHFLANASLFQAAVLAYNTLRWMALLSGNNVLKRWEPKTIRTFLIRVAGKLLTASRRLCLRCCDPHLYPDAWRSWLKLSEPI